MHHTTAILLMILVRAALPNVNLLHHPPGLDERVQTAEVVPVPAQRVAALLGDEQHPPGEVHQLLDGQLQQQTLGEQLRRRQLSLPVVDAAVDAQCDVPCWRGWDCGRCGILPCQTVVVYMRRNVYNQPCITWDHLLKMF